MDLYEELVGLIEALGGAGLEYALCGGIAVAFHGYPRFTKDIDVLIRSQDVDRVLDVVRDRGFVFDAGLIQFDAGGPHERTIQRVSKVQGQEILTLDLLIVNPLLQDVWDGREVFDWKGRRVQIVSADGLAQMKRLAGRDQDLLDLNQLGFTTEEEGGREENEAH